MQHLDIADKVAANISRSHTSERSTFRAYAHTYTKDEVFHFRWGERASSSKCWLPGGSCARGLQLMGLGVEAAEVSGRLGLSVERWRELVEAYRLLWWRWRWWSRRDAEDQRWAGTNESNMTNGPAPCILMLASTDSQSKCNRQSIETTPWWLEGVRLLFCKRCRQKNRYQHLIADERRQITAMRRLHYSQAEIAKELSQSPSTISRELKRNRTRHDG